MRRIGRTPLAAGACGLVVFVLLWELFVTVTRPKPFVLRSPSTIIDTLATQPERFARAALATGLEAFVVLAVAAVVGLALGSLLSLSRFAEHAASPLLTLIQVTPFAAYIASVTIWLHGFGTRRPVLFVGTIVCLPAFVFAAVAGLRGADPAAIDLLRSVGAKRRELWRRVRLPNSLPALFTAARYNVGVALIAAYLTEGGGVRGLGTTGSRAVAENNGDLLWATVFCMAVLGLLALGFINVVERRAVRWHVSQRVV